MSIINFIYKDQQYPIERKLLNKYSTYFSKKKGLQKAEIKNYFLVNEFDSQRKYSEETIQSFLQYFRTGKIELNDDNVLSIKYLSTKYQVSDLINKADKYIDDYYEDLIENFLSVNENKEIEMYESQFLEENLLSYHMSEYISDDRLTSLPINVLYRLISYSPSKKQNQSNTSFKKTKSKSKRKLKKTKPKLKEHNEMKAKVEDNQIVDFLMKVVKFKGAEATILFKAVKLSKEGIEYLFDKLRKEIECDENIDIDFNFIKKEIILYLSYKKDDDIEKASIEKENQNKMKDEFIERFGEVEDEQKNIRNEIKSQTTDLRKEINTQNTDLRDQIKTQDTDLRKEINTQNTDLRKEIKTQDTDLRKEIDAQNTDLRDRIKTQDTDLRKEIKTQDTDLRKKIDTQNTDLKDQIKTQTTDLKKEINDKIQKVESDINSNINKNTTTVKTEFEEIKLTMKQEIENLQRNMKKIIMKMSQENQEMQTKMKLLNDSYEKTIAEIKRKINIQTKNILDIINTISDKKDNEYSRLLTYLCEENIQSKEPTELFDTIFIPNSTKNIKEMIYETNYHQKYEPFHGKKISNFNQKNEEEIGIHSETLKMLYSNDKFDASKFKKIEQLK